MKVSAATPKPTTRKETYGKEVTVMHLRRSNNDERDQENPRVWRAVIYLYEPDAVGRMAGKMKKSIARQRERCRYEATILGAEVVGEFVDVGWHAPLRSALHMALEAAQNQRVDYLVVTSLDHLLDGTQEDAFEVAWRLGHAGTVPIPTNSGD